MPPPSQSSQDPPSGWPPGLARKAEYIFDLLQSLAHVARSEDPALANDLVYFLEMAALEADRLRQGKDRARGL